MRKGRIKYYFKNKNAVINDVGKLCDMNEQLEQELERYKNIIKNIEKLVDNQLHGNFVPTGRTDGKVLQEIERKIEELKGE